MPVRLVLFLQSLRYLYEISSSPQTVEQNGYLVLNTVFCVYDTQMAFNTADMDLYKFPSDLGENVSLSS